MQCVSFSETTSIAVVALLFVVSAALGQVKHPNLLLNGEEIEQIKLKVAEHDWATRLFERLKESADARHGYNPRDTALVYVISGDRSYGEAARRRLLQEARYNLARLEEVDLANFPEHGAWSPLGMYAWAYDLVWDVCSQEDRQLIERWLSAAARNIIAGEKLHTTTPNLVFGKHFNVGLVGYCLGDKELIDWALNDPGAHGPRRGGFYPVMDTMIRDGHFWGEAPIYALHYDVHGMIALAEAALHYDGTDLYSWVSHKSGASIKSLIDGYVLTAYPLEDTGIGRGSVRLATFGDGSTCCGIDGTLVDTFLVNPIGTWPTIAGEMEVAYKRYGDSGYAWLLGLDRDRDTNVSYGRATLGMIALTHGEPLPENPTPPPAPSGVYPSQGFAMLRADESPEYWTSRSLAAVVRTGKAIPHGHNDFFSLILHGKGRVLLPDVNVIQYESSFLNWTHEGIAHNTLLVDRASPSPCDAATRHEFSPEVKFFAVTGSPFAGVTQTRAVLLTREYCADIFQAADAEGRNRTFDYVLHGLGRLYPGNPAAWRPSNELVAHYWWIENERSREVRSPWQVDWVQTRIGAAPGAPARPVGVRTTLAAGARTAYIGDGPLVDGPPHARIEGNPEGSLPLMIARTIAPSATYLAVHEPYDTAPVIGRVTPLQQNAQAAGMRIEGPAFSDRVLVSFEKQQTDCVLRGRDHEVFVFSNYGYVRVAEGRVVVRGGVSGFRVLAPDAQQVIINGAAADLVRDGDYVVFGRKAGAAEQAWKPPVPDPAERLAAVHYYFLPEEVHLRAGREREVTMHLRCVGAGEVQGMLDLQPPDGIMVVPAAVPVKMSEGDELTIRLVLRDGGNAKRGLHEMRIVPGLGTRAAEGTVRVSVGVVITEDNRLPRMGEYIVRAPGYTIAMDKFSGTAVYLLDGDGNRRFGRVWRGGEITPGCGAVKRGGKWSLRYPYPCEFVWARDASFDVGCDGMYGDGDLRVRHEFYDDRIVISLIPPTRPMYEQTMWLGLFDALGEAVHGTLKEGDRAVGEWFYYPHPRFRQGVLITLPPGYEEPKRHYGTSLYFPMRVNQKVTLQFVEEDELP